MIKQYPFYLSYSSKLVYFTLLKLELLTQFPSLYYENEKVTNHKFEMAIYFVLEDNDEIWTHF